MDFSYLKKWEEEAMKRTEGRGEAFRFLFQPPVGANDIVVDLHGHTKTFSDGERTLSFYKKTAKKNRISKVAVTDHDSIGIDDTPDGFINGVEVTTLLDGNEIEILIYGYDQQKAQALIDSGVFPYLDKDFKFLRNLELTKRRIEICNKLGLTDKKLSLSDVLNIEVTNKNGEVESLSLSQIGINADHIIHPGEPLPKNVVYKGEVYPIKYSYLIRKLFNCIHADPKGFEFLNSKTEIDSSFNPHSSDDFMKLVVANKYGELHVESEGLWPTPQECVAFAIATGGITSIAHLFGYSKKLNITILELLHRLIKIGIEGIEVMHGFNQSDEIELLYKLCYEYGLIPTMGSDTHGFVSYQGGAVEPGIAPGVGYQMRYTENNVDGDSTSLYNLFYYGTGAWRGEKEFDYLSIPPSIHEALKAQEKLISKNKAYVKKKKTQIQNSERAL